MSETSLGEKATAFLPEQTRTVGLKFILVGVLAILMWIPALFIYVLSFERSARADGVQREIYEREGGEQRLAGPFLIIPAIEEVEGYRDSAEDQAPLRSVRRTYVLLPDTLNADIDVTTDERRRSIYSATVYDSRLSMSGRFDLDAIETGQRTRLLWDEAKLVLWLPSTRSLSGVKGTPTLKINGRDHAAPFRPGFQFTQSLGEESRQMAGTGLSTALPLSGSQQRTDFSLTLSLSGGGSFGLAPIGNETTVQMKSDWPHPGFQGQIAPLTRDISADGFTASWATSSLSRDMPQSFIAGNGPGHLLARQMMEVDFVTPDSPYAKINRSLKYALLFMGLIFLTVFLLEILYKSRAHPAQYILIGMAQVLFYLMVLALSEHIPFDMAFLGMAVVTVLLSGFYASSVFQRRSGGIVSALAFTGVYSLIWLLMKSEDYALLIGASCAFTALAFTMYATRNIDWYGSARQAGGPAPQA